MLKIIIKIALLFFLSACGSSAKVSELDSLPYWAKSRPIIEGCYVGIASVKKVGDANTYIRKAREKALADLASEISVTVNSSSVLHSVSSDLNISETMYNRNELKVTDYFEGFEPVDYYEGTNDYWVFYKINKEIYKQKKNEKKQKASALALENYALGLDAKERNEPMMALSYFLKGLEHISDYNSENVPATYKGENLDLGRVLYQEIQSVISDLKVTAIQNEVQVTRATETIGPIQFSVKYKGEAAAGVPLGFTYSAGYLKTNKYLTDNSGVGSCVIGKVNARSNKEQLSASIDLNGIVRKAVHDVFIRGFMKKLKTASAHADILIQDPSLSVNISGSGFKQAFDHDNLMQVIQKNALKYGYVLVKGSSDLHLDVIYKVKNLEQISGIYPASIHLKIDLLSQGEVWAHDENERIEGAGRSMSKAQAVAWQELNEAFELRMLPNVLDQVFAE